MKLVLVEWEDSSSFSGWHHLHPDADGICNCISIGLLCQEDKKQVTVAQSRSDSGNYGDTISVPRSCIKRIRFLKVQ